VNGSLSKKVGDSMPRKRKVERKVEEVKKEPKKEESEEEW